MDVGDLDIEGYWPRHIAYCVVENAGAFATTEIAMRDMAHAFAGALTMVVASAFTPAAAQQSAPIESKFAEVNGVRLHYLVAGKGQPIFLLHGYAQNSHMWRPLIAELAQTHTVIAPDLRKGARDDRISSSRLRQFQAASCSRSPRHMLAIPL